MSELKRILGSSTLSLLLVMWGLFTVCSGRVPDVEYDDEFGSEDSEFTSDLQGSEDDDLMS